MKNKKKTTNQAGLKNESKYDKKQSLAILKKSPIKVKANNQKPPFLSSLDASNFKFQPYKQPNTFYGKKQHQNQVSQKKVGDSNQSSTHCSINNRSHKQKSFENKRNAKSKSLKGTKNQFYCSNDVEQDSDIDISLSSVQVMTLINNYATKIQRQWRRHWFRKCLRFIVLKERQRKQFQLMNAYARQPKKQIKHNLTRFSNNIQSRIPAIFNQQTYDQKRRTLPMLNSRRMNQQEKSQQSFDGLLIKQVATENQNQITDEFFNNKKYDSLSLYVSGKTVSNMDQPADTKSKQSHERTSSLGEKIADQLYLKKSPPQMVEIGLNCSLQNSQQYIHYMGTPISQLKNATQNSDKKSSEKKSHIKLQPKVYELHVFEQNKKSPNSNIPKQLETKKSSQGVSPQNLTNNYDIKFPSTQSLNKDPFGMTKVFKKCKKAIQKKVTKKLEKLDKNYGQKQITERTYKNLKNQTKQKMKTQIKSLQLKQGHLKTSWKEVYVMFKEYVKENSCIMQQSQRNQDINCGNASDDHQISFDKWDFESSAKKSISQLESFEDFARQLNERNPDKLKGFYIDAKRQNSQNRSIQRVFDGHRSIQRVLDELDKLQSPNHFQSKNQHRLNFTQQDDHSILQQFRQRQRSNSFQKKSQQILIEDISQKLSRREIKSPIQMVKSSPRVVEKPLNKLRYIPEGEGESFGTGKQLEAKRQVFEFTQVKTPVKSKQKLQQKEIKAEGDRLYVPKGHQHVVTDESQQDSEVEIKITSINAGNGFESTKEQRLVFVNKVISSSIQDKDKKIAEEQENERKRKLKEKKVTESSKNIQRIACSYYNQIILPKNQSLIKEISKLLRQVFRQKKRKKQLQQMQLKKYPATIDPSIDAINNWLLQISHHLLDHHNSQIKKNLLNPKQLPKEELLQICQSVTESNLFYHSHPYITISQKIFKQFEFFYLKNIASNLQVEDEHQHNFQHLLYGFHRCLIDCMNLTLLDELSIGKNWVVIPWLNIFRYKKKQVNEHAKQCLQRAINKVSGWGEYSLAQLSENTEISNQEWKQYQEEKINLVIREQVLDYSLDNQLTVSNLVMQIFKLVYEEEILSAARDMSSILTR